MEYIHRAVDRRLDVLAAHFPAIAIDGPKAVGKTETARRRVRTVFRMDSEDDQNRFLAVDLVNETRRGPLLIDEWQRLPQSWDLVRRAVDNGAPPGSIYLTGSATPQAGVTTHTGAGRIMSVRLRPLGLCELTVNPAAISLTALCEGGIAIEGQSDTDLAGYLTKMYTTGFPAAMGFPADMQQEFLASYAARIVDRELPAQGYTIRNRFGLQSWLHAYAQVTGTDASYSEILARATEGSGDAPSKRTTAVYREKLDEIWMFDELPAWESPTHQIPGQTRSPKHYLADVALGLHLAGIRRSSLNTSENSGLLGRFFEAYAVHSLRVAATAAGLRSGHVRTKKRAHEVDLVLETLDGRVLAFEIKLAGSIRDEDVRHLHWLRTIVGDDLVEAAVVYTGTHAYRRPDGVAVIPLALIGV